MSSRIRVILDPPYRGTLDAPHFFTAGEWFTGRVRLTLDREETVGSVRADFTGKVKVTVGQGQSERVWTYVLFQRSEYLVREAVKLAADVYEYPFSFSFPENFTLRNEFHDDTLLFRGLGTSGMHALPPSCDDAASAGSCAIYYRVTARVPRTFSDWVDKATLTLTTCRAAAYPDPRPVLFKSLDSGRVLFKLTDTGLPRPLGKRESVLNAFHQSDDVRNLVFTMTAEGPTTMVVGKPYDIEIRLVSMLVGGNLETTPDFQLRDYSVFLKNRTIARLPGIFSDQITDMAGHILIAYRPLMSALSLDSPKRFTNVLPWKAPGIPPTFSCFAVKRTYDLELKATVTCLGDDIKFKMQWRNVTVLPPRMEPGVEEAIRSLGTAARELPADDAGAPPSYEASQKATAPLPAYRVARNDSS